MAIGRAIGVQGVDDTLVAEETVKRTKAMLSGIGIPNTLKELGLKEDRLDWVAEQSMLAARLINNNRRKLDVDAVRHVVRQAYYGTH